MSYLANQRSMIFLVGFLVVFSLGVPAQEEVPSRIEDLLPHEVKAQGYYHFTLGYHYEELASRFRRGEYFEKAIAEYKEALRYLPGSSEIVVRLADTYRRAGRIRQAVEETQAILKDDPDNLAAHRLLGRIYFQTLGNAAQAQGRATLGLAIEQYRHVIRLAPSDTDALLTLARLHRFNNDLEKAEAALEKLLSVEPASEDGMSELALIYSFRGEHQRAVDLLQGTAVETSSAQLLSRLGQAYEQSEDFESAIQTYRRALKLKEDYRIRGRLAEVLFRTGKFESALEEYLALQTMDPQNAQVLLRLAQIYRAQKQYEEAGKVLNEARAMQPGNLEIAFNQALLREALGDFSGAVEVLQTLLEKVTSPDGQYSPEAAQRRSIVLERLGVLQRQDNDFPGAAVTFSLMKKLGGDHVLRGWVQILETHRQARDLDKAVAVGEAALEEFPNSSRLKLQLAGVLGERGDWERGVKLALEQEKAGADSQQVQLTLAQIYERTRHFDEALAVLDKVQESAKTAGDLEFVHFLRGAVYERRDDIDKAEAEFQKVLEINPESALALNYLGYMLADNNRRLEEALDFIQKAVEMEPYNGAYLDSLGWAYFRLKKMDLAEKYLLQATNRTINDATLYDHLGEVYFETGRLALAEKAWERSRELWEKAPATDFDKEEFARLEDKLRRLKIRLAQKNPASKSAPPPR